MKTIVLDTNIFISAILGPKGYSRTILRGCLEGKYLPLMGNALFKEYEDLLQREHLFTSCILNQNERTALFNAFLSVCEWITVYYRWRPNLRDEADNHLIELAVAGAAAYLITQNLKDFTNPELQFPHLQIVNPATFLKEESPWPP